MALAGRFRSATLESGLSGSPLSRSRWLTTSEIGNMKIILSLVALCLVTAVASAQNVPVQDPLLSENTVKVSDHVWAIMGWPNIGIVVGENATLVVDTGLGPRNGATVARVAKRLAPNNKLYLTTTHFHPEHAGGASGFPAGTVLIRD